MVHDIADDMRLKRDARHHELARRSPGHISNSEAVKPREEGNGRIKVTSNRDNKQLSE